MSSDDLTRSVRDFLKRRGEPASSLLIADRFLRLRAPGEEVATRILEPLLRPAGLVYEAEVGWRAGVVGARERGTDLDEPGAHVEVRRVACAVGIVPRGAARARGGAAAARSGDTGAAPAPGAIQSACFIEIAPGPTVGAPHVSAPIRIDRLDWPAIGALLEGAEAIFAAPAIESPPLIAGLARRGLARPASIRALAAVAREAIRIPRGAGVEKICDALGCEYRDGDSAADAAANVAACVKETMRLAAGAPEPPGDTSRLFVDEPGARSGALHPGFLASVPARPGVYRFYDDEGGLLYVGKAANLRSRLSSHAAAGGARRVRPAGSPRQRRGLRGTSARPVRVEQALARLHRVEYDVLGSDLEALLKEARMIAGRSPRANTQREVHERGRLYAPGRTHAILLSAKAPRAVAVVFVRDGRYEGSCLLGPRGGGTDAASRILGRLFDPSRDAAKRARSAASGERVDPESEILNSWLVRHGDRVSRVDLDSSDGPRDALRALIEARGDVAQAAGETIHRRSRRSGGA